MKSIARRLAWAWGAVLYLLVPTAFVSWLIAPDLIEIGVFAASVGALSTLMHRSWRMGLCQVGAFAVLGALAALLSPFPVAAGVFLGACGLALGLSSVKGWNYSLFLMPILLASILIDPVPATSSDATAKTMSAQGGGIVLSILAILLVAGVLSVVLCLPILARMKKTLPSSPLPTMRASTGLYFGIVLALCLGIATWWVLSEERVPDASWLLLTFVLLLQPTVALTPAKSVVRALGTVGGSAIAVLIALIPSEPVVIVLTVLLAGAASVAVFDTRKRYWLWVVLWTPSIILLTSQHTDIIRAAEFRLVGTIIAAAIAVGLVLIVQALRPRKPAHGPGVSEGSAGESTAS